MIAAGRVALLARVIPFAWDDGGSVGVGGSSTLVTGSIPDGNTVIVFWKQRSPSAPAFTHASGLNGLTLIEGPLDSGFGDDGVLNVYSATKNGTGTLTLTPTGAGEWWRAIVWDCGTLAVVDSNLAVEGIVDSTISYVSPTMPSPGGTGIGASMDGRSVGSITLTAPTWDGIDVEEAYDSNFRLAVSYGSITIAGSATSTMTGTLSETTTHFEMWVLLQSSDVTTAADTRGQSLYFATRIAPLPTPRGGLDDVAKTWALGLYQIPAVSAAVLVFLSPVSSALRLR
jgi:hypothetical protein